MFTEPVHLKGVCAHTMRRETARAETENKVICAAEELFSTHGYSEATIRDIAQRAGVSVGTVMSCGDKEALLVRIFDGLIEAEHTRREGEGTPVVQRIRKTKHNPTFAPNEATETCFELVKPFLELFTNRLDLARIYASILLSGRHSSEVFQALGKRLIKEFAQTISTHTQITDPLATARALHAAYIGTLFIWASSPDRTLDVEAQLRTHFHTIISPKT